MVLSPLGLPVLFPRRRHLLTRLVQYCFHSPLLTRLVQYCFHSPLIVCVCVCLDGWMDGCVSPFHFESVTLCVCARNNLTSNCEQKRTLHFSMTGNFFSMTRNFFASPGNFFAFDSLHFWMTKCTERRLLLLGGSAKRSRP